ncbi:MAG TPA: hypothetical protein V6C81_05450 [Planktothrix sp.]|jgi:hypothetical protein
MAKKARSQQADTEIKALGEVISSTVTTLVAQCWQSEDSDGLLRTDKPNFGSFLRIECNESQFDVAAVVYNVITGPQDSVHKPSALGLSRQRLKIEQPHIFALLRTEVHAAIIGYALGDRAYHHLPPQPPEVHDFVYPAAPSQIEMITEEFDFLRLLSTISEVPSDELLAAAIREAYKARDCDYAFLVSAGQALSNLLRSDYDRLVCVLRKIRPGVV